MTKIQFCLFISIALTGSVFSLADSVRYSLEDRCCDQEKNFIGERRSYTDKALRKFLGDSNVGRNKKDLTIALCFSGGGMRALYSTHGFLKAAKETGLLDCATYMAGLSGSSWALASWIASGKNILDFTRDLNQRLGQGLMNTITPEFINKLADYFLYKITRWQDIDLMEVYALFLSNFLLSEHNHDCYNVTLSGTHKIDPRVLPLPIYTAVETSYKPYTWIEFTPFEVGSSSMKSYIPTSLFGRSFYGGHLEEGGFEKSLGYCMAIFGSAFAVSVKDVVRHGIAAILSSYAIPALVRNFVSTKLFELVEDKWHFYAPEYTGDHKRIASGTVPNWTYGMSSDRYTSGHAHIGQLSLVDAGIDFNLPIPPLLRKDRKIDVIIIYDISSPLSGAPSLFKAQEYARSHNYFFPAISHIAFDTIDKKRISVFEGDYLTPTIIYMPCIANTYYSKTFDPQMCAQDDYCKTLNFDYDHRQIEELSGLSYFTLKQNIPVIQEALKNRVRF